MGSSISSINRSQLMGGVILPAIVGAAYGTVARLLGMETLAVCIVLMLGGVVSIFATHGAINTFFSPPGRSWSGAIGAMSILVPYAYSLFLVVYLGLIHLWAAATEYHGLSPIIGGLFWLIAGSRMLFVLGKIGQKDAR